MFVALPPRSVSSPRMTMKHAVALGAPLGRWPVASSGSPTVPPRPLHQPRRTEPTPPARGGSGIYPSPFGFVLSVPVSGAEHLVPIAGASATALAPLAGALDLARASGGFQVERVTLLTAHARLTFFDVRDLARAKSRVAVLARDLLTLAQSSLPARERLRLHPALELRSSGGSTLCLSVHGDGPLAADEDRMLALAQILLPPLARLIEANASISTETLLLRRVRVSCRVALDQLVAQLASRRSSDPERERAAVRRALDWFGATRASSALASAWNDIVLEPVAGVARALGQNGHHTLAEGQRYACRFGSIAPLARFELDGRALNGQIQLPCGLGRRARRHDGATELAHRLLLGHSADDVAERAACVGLAAGLASFKAAVSLALSGRVLRQAGRARPEASEQTAVLCLRRAPPVEAAKLAMRPSARVEETRVMALDTRRELQRLLRDAETPRAAEARESAPLPPGAAERRGTIEGPRRGSGTRLRAPELAPGPACPGKPSPERR